MEVDGFVNIQAPSWEDDGWGAVNTSGVRLRFPEGGQQYIQIQTREDGASVDQVVLSAEEYLTMRPGGAKKDATMLKRTFPVRDPWAGHRCGVLSARSPVRFGTAIAAAFT